MDDRADLVMVVNGELLSGLVVGQPLKEIADNMVRFLARLGHGAEARRALFGWEIVVSEGDYEDVK